MPIPLLSSSRTKGSGRKEKEVSAAWPQGASPPSPGPGGDAFHVQHPGIVGGFISLVDDEGWRGLRQVSRGRWSWRKADGLDQAGAQSMG